VSKRVKFGKIGRKAGTEGGIGGGSGKNVFSSGEKKALNEKRGGLWY